jgi:hypothetical protein
MNKYDSQSEFQYLIERVKPLKDSLNFLAVEKYCHQCRGMPRINGCEKGLSKIEWAADICRFFIVAELQSKLYFQ